MPCAGWRAVLLAAAAAAVLTEEEEAAMAKRLEPLLHAIKLKPSSAHAYAKAGEEYTLQGDPRNAVQHLRVATRLSPRLAELYGKLGFALYRGAESTDRHAARGSPKQPPVRVAGGDDPCWRDEPASCFPLEHYKRTQLHIAESDFLRRVEKDPQDWYGFALLGVLYRNRSVDACRVAIKLQPDYASAYLTLSRVLPLGGSLSLLRKTLELLPTHVRGYRELGGVLKSLRYWRQANDAYRHALALEPSSAASYNALVELRLARSRPAEATSLAYEALALHPNVVLPFGGRAGRLRRDAEPESIPDDAVESVAMVGEAHALQRRYDEAAAVARFAVTLRGDDDARPEGVAAAARGYRVLGHALYELGGRADEAVSACEAAVALRPSDADSHFRAAMLLREVPGKLRETIDHLNGVLRQDERYPGAAEAQEVATTKLRKLQYPKPTRWSTTINMLQILALLAAGTYFLTN